MKVALIALFFIFSSDAFAEKRKDCALKNKATSETTTPANSTQAQSTNTDTATATAENKSDKVIPDRLKQSRAKDPNAEEVVIKARRYSGPEEFTANFKKDTTTLRLHNNQVSSVQELLLDRLEQTQAAVINQARNAKPAE